MSSRRRPPPPAGSSANFSPFEVMDEVTPHRQMSSTAANPASLATSPFSPFPFGTPITHSRRSVLNPGPIQNAGGGNVTVDELQQTRKLTPIQTRVRLRGRDMYGGPIVYGVGSAQSSSGTAASSSLPPVAAAATMASSLRRSNRLLSAAPYNASMRIHNRSQRQPQQQPQQPQLDYSANDHDDYSPMDSAGISSTAKVILDTLEKMSTPIRDAQRIPMPAARAETRRAIAEQLLDRPSSALGGGGSAGSSPTTSESSSSYSRRRPRLGRTTPISTSNASGQLLNGPPLRTLFSPVSSSFRGSGAPRCERNGDLTYSASAPIKRLSGDESILGNKSSKKVPSAASTSSPWQKKSTLPFSVPALQPSAKSKEGGGAASSGKIRTKVGEKAKMRAEKALFDDAGAGSDEGPPPHLKNATETINPFMKMNSMPQFNFQQESIISSESGRNNSKRKDEDSTDVPKNLKTSSSINPLPVSSNFSFPTTASKLPVEIKAAAVKAAPPSGTPLPTGAATFVFTRPLCVSHSPASALEGAGRFSYAFSDPTKPGDAGASSQSDLNRKEASSPPSLISPSSRGANLPDLTSGASSSGGTVRKMTESQPKQVGVARAAVTLKSASVMDILSGNGNHKLPDVAASAGKLSAPVKVVAQGSVLDILGQDKRNGSDAWNFSQPSKPWQ